MAKDPFGKAPEEPASSRSLANIGNQLYMETDPLRRALISDSMGFLGVEPYDLSSAKANGPIKTAVDSFAGRTTAPELVRTSGQPYDARNTREFQYYQNAANRAYSQGKENILAELPQGGALAKSLAELDINRTGNLLGAEADIYNRNMDRAYGLATGAPLTASTSSLANAGNIQAQVAGQGAMMNAEAKQGLGQGIGYGIKAA